MTYIDKLVDNEPDKQTERVQSQHQIFSQIKAGIRRDLENLLNAKIDWTSLPDNCSQLSKSLVNYGLPDFTSTNLAGSQSREDFIEVIETTIANFESRFEKVEVELLDETEEVQRHLRFTIRAMLKGDSSSEIISFNSRVEPVNRKLHLDSD